jgi:hypothetical protein
MLIPGVTSLQNLASLLLQSRWIAQRPSEGVDVYVPADDSWDKEEKAEKLLLQAIDMQPSHFPSLAQYAQLCRSRACVTSCPSELPRVYA